MTMLVNSHLHFDHVGGNKHFPETGVKNVVHELELAQARSAFSRKRSHLRGAPRVSVGPTDALGGAEPL
jgi:glyoxylase-like metal-dependent hydrolase (beta-lactamase superfamily II)